jgi:hypothetical protein
MAGVTEGGPGFVAVGQVGARPAVWTSVDGRRWERVAPDAEAFTGGGAIKAVARTEGGLVAVGVGDAWTSRDGLAWSKQRVTSIGKLIDVAAGPDGPVAVGTDLVLDTNYAAAWARRDDGRWRRRPRETEALGTGVITSVTRWGDGLVAMGDPTRLWLAPDGVTWVSVPIAGNVLRGAIVREVLPLGDGLVVVGSMSLTPMVWVWSPPSG